MVKPNSAKKISIIMDYFDYWLKKNSSAKELYYVDLFSGPGVYNNGEKSTPILILEKILKNKKIANKFNVVLNDKNKHYMKNLERKILQLDNVTDLKSIKFSCQEVGKGNQLPKIETAHGFIILDPWGYKGLSSEKIRCLLKNKNIELIFLFSFNQLYRFLKFKGIDSHLLNLFSRKSLRTIRAEIDKSENKEAFLLDNLMKNIISKRQNYLCYRFKFETQNKTSHFLIFLNHDSDTKAALLNMLLKQNHDNAVGNIDWQKHLLGTKNAYCSCFVLFNMIKCINKYFKKVYNKCLQT